MIHGEGRGEGKGNTRRGARVIQGEGRGERPGKLFGVDEAYVGSWEVASPYVWGSPGHLLRCLLWELQGTPDRHPRRKVGLVLKKVCPAPQSCQVEYQGVSTSHSKGCVASVGHYTGWATPCLALY